jgi:hypothetical protein
MIGPKSIARMKLEASDNIDVYAKQIDDAFMKSEDGKLKVSIGFDLCVSQIQPTGIEISTTISFVADRIKAKTISTVVENQADLPLDKCGKG